MGKEVPPCQAPYHAEGCNGRGETRDHFTPKVIGKILDINVRREENYQWLSSACHQAKDRDTPLRADVLRYQQRGSLSFWDHKQIFEQGRFKL